MWIDEIHVHLISSEGSRFFKSAKKFEKPWRTDAISEKQFLEEADTGDILLFKGKSLSSSFIRTVTGGQFDHIAMVLKFDSDPNEVFLIDATGNNGVSLNRWNFIRDFVGPDECFTNAVYRHVEVDRTNKMMDALELFLKEAVGRKYGLGGNKLLRRKTIVGKKMGDCQLIDEERTFFCSELIAKAFKVLGLIENDNTSCSSYMPSHFAALNDKNIKWTSGTKMHQEM
jgi:hypothetical protein